VSLEAVTDRLAPWSVYRCSSAENIDLSSGSFPTSGERMEFLRIAELPQGIVEVIHPSVVLVEVFRRVHP
jgi:hypothetical protein